MVVRRVVDVAGQLASATQIAAAVLARFGHLEAIPPDYRDWHVNAANPGALARTLAQERDRALLFRTLATLRADLPLFDDVETLRWRGDS